MLLVGDTVTTSLPGHAAAARCTHCHGVLLVTRPRLPRIWAGEDPPWCDDCIPDALAQAARPPRDHHEPT